MRLRSIIEAGATPKKIDTQVIFDSFEGQTLISLTDMSMKVLTTIAKHWKDRVLEPELDKQGDKVEHSDYRRIKFIALQKPFIVRDEKEPNRLFAQTCMIKHIEQATIRDVILKISGLSPSYNIF